MAFQAPIDIKDRALDHCGQEPLDPALELTDGKKGRLLARVYGPLRQAELEAAVWRFSIRLVVLRPIDISTMLLVPALWVSTTTYFVGSIVSDSTGQPWISVIPNNVGNDPTSTPAAWQQYFGPLTVSLYDSTTSYSKGELVYTTPGDGTSRVYQSQITGNTDNPATATAWDATETYYKNQVITYSSVAYMSRIDFNINQTPNATTAAADWASGTTYGLGALVTGSDGIRYTSLSGGNVGNDPISSPASWSSSGVLTPWQPTFVGGSGSINWLQIGGTEFPSGVSLSTMNTIYPLGSGPLSQSSTRNVFRLPASYLRQAPADPKAGSVSDLGAPSGMGYTDWNFENNVITSRDAGAITLRFVADVVDVSAMTSLFCETLAARIGMEICEPLTQSSDKISTIASIYKAHRDRAVTVNGIETGSTESPIDDYLAVRA